MNLSTLYVLIPPGDNTAALVTEALAPYRTDPTSYCWGVELPNVGECATGCEGPYPWGHYVYYAEKPTVPAAYYHLNVQWADPPYGVAIHGGPLWTRDNPGVCDHLLHPTDWIREHLLDAIADGRTDWTMVPLLCFDPTTERPPP